MRVRPRLLGVQEKIALLLNLPNTVAFFCINRTKRAMDPPQN